MRGIAYLTGILVVCALAGGAAHAAPREQPWCAGSRGHDITYEICGFPSLEACRQEILGMGGWCYPNPRYAGPGQRGSQTREPRRARPPDRR